MGVSLSLALALTSCGSSTTPASNPGATSATAAAPTGSTPPPTSGSTTSSTGVPVPSAVLTFRPGFPTPGPTPTATDSYVAWGDKGQLLVVTFGSSGCPKFPTTVTAAAGNALTVTTAAASDRPCTMDFSPTTSTVAVPTGIDDTQNVQVALDGQESTLLPR